MVVYTFERAKAKGYTILNENDKKNQAKQGNLEAQLAEITLHDLASDLEKVYVPRLVAR